MDITRGFIKARYTDMRTGGVTINPLVQSINFIMISYTMITLSLGIDISIYLYAPLFLILIFAGFTVAGLFFRRHQLSTDENLKYERQRDFNITLFEFGKQLKKISGNIGIPIDGSFNDELDRLKRRANL